MVLIKHEEIVDDLESRLNKICTIVGREQDYVLNDGHYGEYDLAGFTKKNFKDDKIYVIEVKEHDITHPSMMEEQRVHDKVLRQLEKDYIHFKEMLGMNDYQMHFFYACSADTRRGYDVISYKPGNKFTIERLR